MFALLIAINSGLLFQKELCKRMIEMYEVALKLLEHLKLIVFGSLFGNYLPNLFQKIIKTQSKRNFIRELLQKNF